MTQQSRRTPPRHPAPGLAVARGVCLVLLGLVFGYIAVRALPGGPTQWNEYATELADMIWRGYFAVVLAFSVAALGLGILSLTRPLAHPVHSVVAGVGITVVGIAGGVLGVLSVTTVEDMGTPLAYLSSGLLLALGGGVVTLLSAIAAADQRLPRRPPAVPRPGAPPANLGLRFLARLVDGALVGVVAVPLAVLAEEKIATIGWFAGIFYGLLGFAYFVAFETSRGRTPGKMLFGLRVRGPGGATAPTLRQSAIRNSFMLLIVIPLLGEVLTLVAILVIAATIQSSPTEEGQHDRFAGGTRVVREPPVSPDPAR